MQNLTLSAILANQAQFDEQAAKAAKKVSAIKAQQTEQQKLMPAVVPILSPSAVSGQNRHIQDNEIQPAHSGQPLQGNIKHIYQAISADKVAATQADFATAFTKRIEFEQQQANVSPKMLNRLHIAQKELTAEPVARAIAALGINADFLNNTTNKGTRFNSYALQRVIEIAKAAYGVPPYNAVTRCFLKSMFSFCSNNLPYTQLAQLASLCDAIRVPKSFTPYLTRHTMSKATAASQRSQMLVALEALDLLVTNGLKGEKQAIALKDTPIVRALETMLV